MASTFTPALRAELMGIGDQANTWGTTANSTYLNVFEQAIAGRAAVVMVNANKTLTALNNASDESRPRMMHLTSSVPLTAQRDVIVPSGAGVTKDWIVTNLTTGGFPIRVKTAAGAGVIVPNGQTRQVMCDGTDVLPSILGATSWTVDSTLFVTAGGASIVGGVTVTSGGIAVTGNSVVTGDLSVTGDINVGDDVTVVGTVTASEFAGTGIDSLFPVGSLRASAALDAESAPWALCDGSTVARVGTYAALFAKLTRTLVGDTVNGSPTITGTFNVTSLYDGMPISGPGIPGGATLTTPINGTTLTLSVNATVTASGVSVVVAPWGVGDGSTTFNKPDLRGRAMVGRDIMVTAAGRLTTAGSGFDGRRMGATGGSQFMQQHLHALTDPGHPHTFNDPGHGHPVVDPGHFHTSLGQIAFFSGGGVIATYAGPGGGNLFNGTGASVDTKTTGISITNNTTGGTVATNTTGITVQNTGTGTSQNMPPGAAVNIYIRY